MIQIKGPPILRTDRQLHQLIPKFHLVFFPRISIPYPWLSSINLNTMNTVSFFPENSFKQSNSNNILFHFDQNIFIEFYHIFVNFLLRVYLNSFLLRWICYYSLLIRKCYSLWKFSTLFSRILNVKIKLQ